MSEAVLSRRALNRATLARQLLLRRTEMPALDAVAHLVGLQAQEPQNPYVGLWSRLDRFSPDELSQLLVKRAVARIVVMRGTLHLVIADDALLLCPLTQPVLDKELLHHRDYAPALRGLDMGPVLDFVPPLLAERPRSGRELRSLIADRFPEQDAAALAYACRCLLALVQVPPRGLWRRSSQVLLTTAESWLGRPLASAPSIDDVVLRYLAAFGPATVADTARWSGLTGLRAVIDRLRPRLMTFRDERGRELFDLPDAPRPDPDVPAPPRFLPEYDNLWLSYADRSRFVTEPQRAQLFAISRPVRGTVLYDGFGCGTWWIDRTDAGTTTLEVNHLARLSKRVSAAVEAQGRRLLLFLEGDTDAERHEVRFVPAA